MEQKKQRRIFDQQFKQDAVDLVVKQGRSVASVACDLGIDQNVLHTWKRQLAPETLGSVPANGTGAAESAEMRKLRRALAIAEEERDILKKALAVFSQRPR
jgi:transposase